jgi:hypothetical protein
MSFHKFKDINFRPDSLERVEQCNRIIEIYQEQNLRLTLRQLYYQLVTQNIIPNQEKSYKNLSKLVSDARLAGLLDWDAIEDRARQPHSSLDFSGLTDLVDFALHYYRLPRWRGQKYYIELWVEKDALAGVLRPLANEFHITLMVNRGYSSQSAMYESAKRYHQHTVEAKINGPRNEPLKRPVLLYLGDHDPSGEDMVRDIRDRLVMFGIHNLEVAKVALNFDQVEEYSLPPNPAKVSDPRAKAYIDKHGANSWEVDALPPEVLTGMIRAHLEKYLDTEMVDAIKMKEERDKSLLRTMVAGLVK